MLLLSIVSATVLLMMTRHRIWLISAAGGAFMATFLWTLMMVFERLLPSTMQAFSGVLAFLLVAVVALGALTVHEKLQHQRDDF